MPHSCMDAASMHKSDLVYLHIVVAVFMHALDAVFILYHMLYSSSIYSRLASCIY